MKLLLSFKALINALIIFLQINALEKNKAGIMSIWEWGYYYLK